MGLLSTLVTLVFTFYVGLCRLCQWTYRTVNCRIAWISSFSRKEATRETNGSNFVNTTEIVSDDRLLYIAHNLTDEWRDVVRYLGVQEPTIYHAVRDYTGNQKEIKVKVLMSWKSQNFEHATTDTLVAALDKAGRRDLAQSLLKEGEMVLAPEEISSNTSTVSRGGKGPTIGTAKRRKSQAFSKKTGFEESHRSTIICKKTKTLKKRSDKEEMFITEIKTKYEMLYDAVQPIPYIRDRLYCVDRVFVEGGIEYLVAMNTIKGYGIWKNLETYQNIFISNNVNSRRRILEGEPGYGKSTVTLQLAYDWCNRVNGSAISNVDILILLRLRQLGGVKSICRAIKLFLLPKDSKVSENDIKEILEDSSLSVVVVLDGFDEYPDQDNDSESDVIDIITMERLQRHDVILTTRSSCLPKGLPPQTKRIKLTGFDDSARDQYIRKAVVKDNEEAVEKIKRRLKDNAVLAGLCQVPLFFVMFAHMSHESQHFQKFNSVTSFFRYMVSCFHNHLKNKMKDKNVKKYDLFETEHQKLDRIAFEGLRGKDQNIVWRKEYLCTELGKDFYSQYVRIGILVEEEVLSIIDKPTAPITEHVQYVTEVRFFHKLFCEWYAAHFLAEYASKDDVIFDEPTPFNPHLSLSSSIDKSNGWNTDSFLKHLNPIDLQFLYRFACGLDPEAGRKIIEYFKKSKEGEKFAILCILEQEEKVENLLGTVEKLCSSKVLISSSDNMLLQRSTIQLLEIASSNGISISCVSIRGCLHSVDLKEEAICLDSGLKLQKLDTLQEMKIYYTDDTDLRDKARDILDFSSRFAAMKKLKFIVVLLPLLIDDKDVLSKLDSNNCKVVWDYSVPPRRYTWELNLRSGRWEDKRGSAMTDNDYLVFVNEYKRHGVI